MELVIHFCNEKRVDRLNEFLFCLQKNLDNPIFDVIHCLCMDGVVLPDTMLAREHLKVVPVSSRPTFTELVEYANKNVSGVAAIANLDIFFDINSKWSEAELYVSDNRNVVLALSRTEYVDEHTKFLDPNLSALGYATAQDAWVFMAPIKVSDCDFEIGTMGADNAFADRLKKSGYYPMNYGTRYKIFHFDVCRGKTAANANAIHFQDSVSQDSIYSRYPEEKGSYLVPDIEKITSVDGIIMALGVDPVTRYFLICDLMSRYIKISNRPQEQKEPKHVGSYVPEISVTGSLR